MRTGGFTGLSVKLASLEARYSVTDSDDLYERSDREAARATDAVMGDLARSHAVVSQAVSAVYLGAEWPWPEPPENLMPLAYEHIGRGLKRRGII